MLIKQWMCVIGLLLGGMACTPEKTINTPIPQEELRDILMEALVIEKACNELGRGVRDSLCELAYNNLLEHHGYELSDFVESIHILHNNPEEVAETYRQVLERIFILEKDFIHNKK